MAADVIWEIFAFSPYTCIFTSNYLCKLSNSVVKFELSCSSWRFFCCKSTISDFRLTIKSAEPLYVSSWETMFLSLMFSPLRISLIFCNESDEETETFPFSMEKILSRSLKISASFSLIKLWILASFTARSPRILTGSPIILVVT